MMEYVSSYINIKINISKMDITFPFLPLTTVISFQLLCLCICLMHIVEISQRLDHCLFSIALKHFIHPCMLLYSRRNTFEGKKLIASAVIGNVQ